MVFRALRRVRGILALVISGLGLLATGAARAEPLRLYHSPADDGSAPAGPVAIAAGTPVTLHLYVDGGSVASSVDPCERGDGDEVCGWDVALAGSGGLALLGIAEAFDVVAHIEGTLVNLNGGDPEGGLGPTKIADLTVQGPMGASLDLLEGEAVRSRLTLEDLQARPVVAVPEPSVLAMLAAGLAMLRALARRRRRHSMAALMTLVAAAGVPSHASAQVEGFLDTEVSSLARRFSTIYYAVGCGGEFDPPESKVGSKNGSAIDPRFLFQSTGCDPDRFASVNLAVGNTGVYWAAGDGRIVRVRTAPAISAPLPVADMAASATPAGVHVALAGGYVWWNENGSIYRAPQEGGARSLLLIVGAPAKDLRASADGRVFYRSGEFLYRADFITGGPFGDFWLGTQIGRAQSYALGNGRVYWADGPAVGSGPVTVRSDLELGGAPTVEATVAVGDPVLQAMAVDDEAIYWLELRGPNGDLVRRRFAGSSNELLLIDRFFTYYQFVASGDYLYWVNVSDSVIRRLPVNAQALTPPNLVAEELEVVQVVQEPSNSVPLVQGKETFARLRARVEPGSLGETTFSAWPLAHLVGTTSGGSPLPGSPLDPIPRFSHPLGNALPDRTTLDEGILFRMPESWTQGDIVLRGVLDPGSVVRETNETDNEVLVAPSFAPKSPICAVVMPVRTVAGTVGGYRSFYRRVLERNRVLLPTPEVRWFWPGGDPWEEYEFPFSSGPYEVSKDDDDIEPLLWRLELHDIFRDDPASCDADNAVTHQVVLVPEGHPNPAVNGSSLGSSIIVFLQFGLDPSNNVANSSVSGVTMAHELGHNYGRDHIDCAPGDPDGVDPGYPYPVCQLDVDDPDAHVGLDPISLTVLPPLVTADLLSYGHRASPPIARWPSDYTYQGVFGELDFVPAGAGAALVQDAGAQAAGPEILVSALETVGGVDFEFDHALELSGAADGKTSVLLAQLSVAPRWILEQRDAADGLLSSHPVYLLPNEEFADARAILVARIPRDPAVSRLVLRDLQFGGLVVGMLGAGGAPPSVSVDAPAAAQVFSGNFKAAWSGSDPDGEPLRYLVRYSRDDGVTWQVLLYQTPFDSLSRDTRGLGQCSQCRLEVTASDGLHSTSALSPAFTVLPDPLEVEIGFRTLDDASVPDHARLRVGEEVVLLGRAYSDEAGTLSGAALTWTVTGPVSRTGTGERLSLVDLAPGDYTVQLDADDGEGGVGSATASLSVEPKEIRDGGTPVLDGRCDDVAYLADTDPIRLRSASGAIPTAAQVRTVSGGGSIWVCAAGLPKNPSAGDIEIVTLRVDTNPDDGSQITTQDGALELTSYDGFAFYLGDGLGGLVQQDPPADIDGAAADGPDSLSVEFRIPGPDMGDPPTLAHLQLELAHPSAGGDTLYSWPDPSDPANTHTWGLVRTGRAQRLSFDLIPGEEPNYVDPTAPGFITAAIFTTLGLDATSDVSVPDLALGPGAAPVVFSQVIDLNGDQALDLFVSFDGDLVGVDPDQPQLCLDGQLVPDAQAFRLCDDFVPTCAPASCDFDGDNQPDASDLCPWIADSGLDSGGIQTSTPDGIGDDCFCGDWDDDGIIQAADVTRLREVLAEVPGAVTPPQKCDINEDGDCNVLDVVILRRNLEGFGAPPIRQTCAATKP